MMWTETNWFSSGCRTCRGQVVGLALGAT